jgi:hypothetical protein
MQEVEEVQSPIIAAHPASRLQKEKRKKEKILEAPQQGKC